MSAPYDPKYPGKKIVTPGNVRPGNLPQSDLSRVIPRQLSSGSTRGTQTVGYGNTKIDGSNNVISVGDSILLDGNNSVITVNNDDGSSIGMGLIPDSDGQFGFYSKDSEGNIIMTIIDGTLLMNDTVVGRVLLGKSDGAF